MSKPTSQNKINMKNFITIFLLALTIVQSQAQTFTKVKDFNSGGSADMDDDAYILYNGKLALFADDGTGAGLWITDGTTGGTIKLTTTAIVSFYEGIYECGGKLYFLADDGTHGVELWVSDGTIGGTAMVKDIKSGIGGQSFINNNFYHTCFNNKLVFVADDGATGQEPWTSDGTSSGTTLLKDIYQGSNPSTELSWAGPEFTVYNNSLYFFAKTASEGKEIWKSDGTTNGTNLLSDLSSQYNEYSSAMMFNNKLLFTEATSSQFLYDIYVSDGTSGGTAKLSDTYPQIANTNQEVIFGSDNYHYQPAIYNNKLLIKADTSYYLTDGTSTGTTPFLPGIANTYIGQLTVSNGLIYFSMNGNLYSTDGTLPNTTLLTPLQNAGYLHSALGKLFFSQDIGNFGDEYWISDGTVNGTTRLKDINQGAGDGADNGRFADYNGKVYMPANDNSNGIELWATDGTTNGTVKVSPPNVTTVDPFSEFISVYDGCLYFIANYDNQGYELWKYCETGVGIGETNKITFQMFPNPNNGAFIIRIPNNRTTVQFTLYNNLGQSVYQTTIDDSEQNLNVGQQPSGLYNFTIKGVDSFSSGKLIIE